MKNEAHFHFHLSHYLFLIVILGFALVYFIINAGNPSYQYKILIGTSLFYFIWGIYHHKLEGDLHPKIVVEYLLISLLAVILLRGALIR